MNMDDIRKAEDFISALFTDEDISVCFKFVPKEGNNDPHVIVDIIDTETNCSLITYYKSGCMKGFLEHTAEVASRFSDDTALVNIPAKAKAALEFIK